VRLIGNLTQPTAGTIKVKGKTAHRARLDRDYGVVFQAPVLFDWRTVQGNVELPLEMSAKGKVRRADRAKAMLALVGRPFLAQPAQRVSGVTVAPSRQGESGDGHVRRRERSVDQRQHGLLAAVDEQRYEEADRDERNRGSSDGSRPAREREPSADRGDEPCAGAGGFGH